jgi:hypothetical protein
MLLEVDRKARADQSICRAERPQNDSQVGAGETPVRNPRERHAGRRANETHSGTPRGVASFKFAGIRIVEFRDIYL